MERRGNVIAVSYYEDDPSGGTQFFRGVLDHQGPRSPVGLKVAQAVRNTSFGQTLWQRERDGKHLFAFVVLVLLSVGLLAAACWNTTLQLLARL